MAFIWFLFGIFRNWYDVFNLLLSHWNVWQRTSRVAHAVAPLMSPYTSNGSSLSGNTILNSNPFLCDPLFVKTPLAQFRNALFVATASLLVSTSRITRTITSFSLVFVIWDTTTLDEAFRQGTHPVMFGSRWDWASKVCVLSSFALGPYSCGFSKAAIS